MHTPLRRRSSRRTPRRPPPRRSSRRMRAAAHGAGPPAHARTDQATLARRAACVQASGTRRRTAAQGAGGIVEALRHAPRGAAASSSEPRAPRGGPLRQGARRHAMHSGAAPRAGASAASTPRSAPACQTGCVRLGRPPSARAAYGSRRAPRPARGAAAARRKRRAPRRTARGACGVWARCTTRESATHTARTAAAHGCSRVGHSRGYGARWASCARARPACAAAWTASRPRWVCWAAWARAACAARGASASHHPLASFCVCARRGSRARTQTRRGARGTAPRPPPPAPSRRVSRGNNNTPPWPGGARARARRALRRA